MRAALTLALFGSCISHAAVVLDRIAIVVNDRVIKDSDIQRDARVTAFINGDSLQLTPQARKNSANRLIDQAIIRREMEIAAYPKPSEKEVDALLAQIREQRYRTDAAYQAALRSYGITGEQLRKQLTWQVAVLQFIEQRFRPGVLVSNEEVERYYQQHQAQFRQASTGKPAPLEDIRQTIEDRLAGEQVNREFFNWLDQTRKQAQIEYREAALK